MVPAVCASLASLFVTQSFEFVETQQDRADLHFIDDLRPIEQRGSRRGVILQNMFRACNVELDAKTGSMLVGAFSTGTTAR